MSILRIMRNPVYFSLAIIYAILVAVLCFRAPLVQRDILDQDGTPSKTALSPSIVADQSQTASPRTSSTQPVQLSPDEVEFESQQQKNIFRAPLWKLGSRFALNTPLFAAELGAR